TIRIWNVETGKEVKKFQKNQPGAMRVAALSDIVLSPDGKYLAVRGWDGSVRLWDAAEGKELKAAVEAPAGNGGFGGVLASGVTGRVPTDLVFSPDGKILAMTVMDAGAGPQPGVFGGMARVIKLWDVVRGKQIVQLEGNQNGIVSLTFSPEGRTIAGREGDKL